MMCYITVIACATEWQLLYAPAPVDNPLKGFVPYDGPNSNFPHSMEFFYLPLAAVQKDYTVFDWSPLEIKLQGIANRGHQAVFRFFVDYPNTPSGLPAFLRHVPVNQYNDWNNGVLARSVSPDYEHPDLRRALTNFIAALGARYDADPRLGFVTVGLLGFWGEWHTYPYNGFEGFANWFASTTVQREVLDTYEAAFRATPLLLREPKSGINITRRRLGFHDDSFACSTLGPESWHFWPMIKSYGLETVWRRQPIGGEIRPELWDCLWNDASCAPPGQAFLRCVETTHVSWLMDSGTFKGIAGLRRERALAGARRLGYELHVNSAELPTVVSLDSSLRGHITITNTGVAPLYHRWPVQFGLFATNHNLKQWNQDWDLTVIQPIQTPVRYDLDIPLQNVAAGQYVSILRISNPLSKGHPIRFANETQDTDLVGWLSLGPVHIFVAPQFSHPTISNGCFQVQLSNLQIGKSVEIQTASSLTAQEWQVVDTFMTEKAWLIWNFPFALSTEPRFFRAQQKK